MELVTVRFGEHPRLAEICCYRVTPFNLTY